MASGGWNDRRRVLYATLWKRWTCRKNYASMRPRRKKQQDWSGSTGIPGCLTRIRTPHIAIRTCPAIDSASIRRRAATHGTRAWVMIVLGIRRRLRARMGRIQREPAPRRRKARSISHCRRKIARSQKDEAVRHRGTLRGVCLEIQRTLSTKSPRRSRIARRSRRTAQLHQRRRH